MREPVRNITYAERNLGDNLNMIRNRLSRLEFPENMTILALQQGVGKTHTFLEFAKRNHLKMKIMYASQRHDQLIENMNSLGVDRARHWYGFSYYDGFEYRGCPLLNENNPLLNRLKGDKEFESLLNPTIICQILGCNQNQCKYHLNHRRNENKIDLIPSSYLGTSLILQQQPDIIFLDESIEEIQEYRYDENLLNECIAIVENYDQNNILIENLNVLREVKSGDIPLNLDNDFINETIESKNSIIVSLIQTENQYSLDDSITLSKLDYLIKYFQNISNVSVDVVYRPKIYDVFDLCFNHEKKIVFLNASFNKNLFEYYLKTYPNPLGNITIPLYTCEIINPKSTLIRVYPNNKFWKGAFTGGSLRTTRNQIFGVLKKVEQYFSKEDIGIITYQKVRDCQHDISVENIFKIEGYDTIHFWAQSGLNILQNKSVLFIIGTPSLKTEDVINKWEEIHNEKSDLTSEEIGGRALGWGLNELGEFGRLGNRGYESFDVYLKEVNGVEKEYDFSLIKDTCLKQIIDSIHRCRALTHSRIVFALGDVPKTELMMILDEENLVYFTDNINYLIGIDQVEINDIDKLDSLIQESNTFKNKKLNKLMHFIIDNREYMTRREIAKALHLWNFQGNPDVNLISDIEDILSDCSWKDE